jgi:hypothetical protein
VRFDDLLKEKQTGIGGDGRDDQTDGALPEQDGVLLVVVVVLLPVSLVGVTPKRVASGSLPCVQS